MTDAHFHRNGFETYLTLKDREFRFVGIHPWQADDNSELRIKNAELVINEPINQLTDEPITGIGEIGLDRLKNKNISDEQRKIFVEQLKIAAELHRPVVLHGAKCWGEVVKECKKFIKNEELRIKNDAHDEVQSAECRVQSCMGSVPAFLFHGFSRSTGLVPEIIAMNGFISLGPAILNDHAVNYHVMAKELPIDRIMLETDIDWSAEQPADQPSQGELLAQMLEKLAKLRGCDSGELSEAIDANVARFVEAIA